MNATYRVQLRPDFGFREVRGLLPYLRKLGISHLYLSPITAARPGSSHGYDVTDHTRIRDELGGEEGFRGLVAAARRLGLKVIIDFVPNHAAVGPSNAAWQDVLAYGPSSPFARYFDIEWDPLEPELRGKVLLPFLARPYGEALEHGDIALAYHEGRFYAAYYEHRFAVSPATYPLFLGALLPDADAALSDLGTLVAAYRALAPSSRDALEALRPRLEALLGRAPADGLARQVTGERLHALLERQFWRLAYWKSASYEINYRRFFYVNDLVGLRVEDEEVFSNVHGLLARMVAERRVDGVRIDHIDGLFDPHLYLPRLTQLGVRQIWVEKILASGETLPAAWPVEGTTGYEFLNDLLRVLAFPGGEAPLDRTYRRFVRDRPPYGAEVYRSKRLVMQHHLAGELSRLAYELDRIAEADYRTRDFSLEGLREALREVIAVLPQYRTYLPYDRAEAEGVLREAMYRARQRNPDTDSSVFEFLHRVLLGDVAPPLREAARAWIGGVQQFAAAVMAKGVEDTAFYRYVRLVALNEVGGDADRFTVTPEAWHARARYRALRYPRSLLATATHDHKRGEDVRMRLIVLAELAETWRSTLRALGPIVRRHQTARGPSAADVYLLFQTLAALWEDTDRAELSDRLAAYMRKAAREAKLHTSWLSPNAEYETALDRFVRGVLSDARLPRRLGPLARLLARHGFVNSLTQLVLKMTAPGVPDVYQGCELLDLSLVDPDNRRPVDFERRRRILREMEPLLRRPDVPVLQRMLAERDERLKLYAMVRLLRARAAHPGPFAGEYRPLRAEGACAEHILAYAREAGADTVVVVVPRFPATLETQGGLGQTSVALPDAWRRDFVDALSGAMFTAGDALEPEAFPLPWAVLVSSPPLGAG